MSKSDQPARLDDAEQARRDEIDARLHNMRRGHHAEGGKWWRRTPDGRRTPMVLHWEGDTYTLVPEETS